MPTDVCRENRVLLVTDEIQPGVQANPSPTCMTGIRPDVLVISNALAGGFYPVSIVLASNEILSVYKQATTAARSAAIRLAVPGAHRASSPDRGRPGGARGIRLGLRPNQVGF
ncbi:MAG: aminotransferase class III-fold pyridoxal phosphate-dependent enzyme [Terriglobales bacterium]